MRAKKTQWFVGKNVPLPPKIQQVPFEEMQYNEDYFWVDVCIRQVIKLSDMQAV